MIFCPRCLKPGEKDFLMRITILILCVKQKTNLFFLRVSKHLKHFSLLPKCKNISHIIIFWKWVKVRFSGDDLHQMGEIRVKIYFFLGVWNQVKRNKNKNKNVFRRKHTSFIVEISQNEKNVFFHLVLDT